MKEAILYQSKKGHIVCSLCEHHCKIPADKTGLCGARKNINNRLYSVVYGYPIAQNIDPVEKKPLYHFFPGSFTYSIGTLGCNLQCANCQNFALSQAQSIEKMVDKMNFQDPEKIVEQAIGNDCKSISFTYNEPTIFTEYALDIMKIARDNGLKNIWVSNGFMSEECLDKIIPYLDAINIDLKSSDDEFYRSNCGGRINPILKNLIRIKQEQIHLEISTLIIPNLVSDIEIFSEIADFIVSNLDEDTPWHLLKFSPEKSWKLKDLPSTGDDLIYEAYEIGKEAGLKYIYVGNIPGDQKENTYCPKCNELAIRRMGYGIIERFDANGACSYCDKNLDIIE